MGYIDDQDEPRYDDDERSPDLAEARAVDALRAFLTEHSDDVFTTRQLEVIFEDRYFHWITHRAVKLVVEERTARLEGLMLSHGAPINLIWHRSNRYTRRQIKEVLQIVEQYSHPDFTAALGNTGELLVSDGFSRFGFQQRGRNVRSWGNRRWVETDHNLDFIFEKDGRTYGVEVKNTLPYIHDAELNAKLDMCDHLGIHPVFVTRAMPAIWIQDIANRGGFTLVLRHHLYPLSHKRLADQVKARLRIPADAPRALYDGTLQRFDNWHVRQMAGPPDRTSL